MLPLTNIRRVIATIRRCGHLWVRLVAADRGRSPLGTTLDENDRRAKLDEARSGTVADRHTHIHTRAPAGITHIDLATRERRPTQFVSDDHVFIRLALAKARDYRNDWSVTAGVPQGMPVSLPHREELLGERRLRQ